MNADPHARRHGRAPGPSADGRSAGSPGALAGDRELVALVRAARAGDDLAWAGLIARYDRSVRQIARSYRLGPADVDDVAQITWVLLHGHIDRLRDARAIGGWLATTARREALRALRSSLREQPSDDPGLGDVSDGPHPDVALLAAEDRAVLGRAVAALPGRQRELIALLVAHPDADYGHISATLAMPTGSIGPIRARGLERLRRDPALRRHHTGMA